MDDLNTYEQSPAPALPASKGIGDRIQVGGGLGLSYRFHQRLIVEGLVTYSLTDVQKALIMADTGGLNQTQARVGVSYFLGK